jgi:hypothetical protein
MCDQFQWENGGESYASLGCPYSIIDKSVEYGTGVDAKLTLASLNPDVCILLMHMLFSHE